MGASPAEGAGGIRRVEPRGSWWKRKGISVIPLIGDLLAMIRLLGDREASIWAKLFVVAAVAYVVSPIDLIPDAIPVIGWLDDAGLVLAMRVALDRQLERYRYPLFVKKSAVGAASGVEVRQV